MYAKIFLILTVHSQYLFYHKQLLIFNLLVGLFSKQSTGPIYLIMSLVDLGFYFCNWFRVYPISPKKYYKLLRLYFGKYSEI